MIPGEAASVAVGTRVQPLPLADAIKVIFGEPPIGGKRIDSSESARRIARAVPIQWVVRFAQRVVIPATRCGRRLRACGENTVIRTSFGGPAELQGPMALRP